MSRLPRGRLARALGWLLTPLVVWAASFLGAWAGAAVGSAVFMVVAGAVAGALGAFAWVRFMRRGRRATGAVKGDGRHGSSRATDS